MVVEGIVASKPENSLFTVAIDYREFKFIKNCAGYVDDVAYSLSNTTQTFVVPMKYRT